VWTASWLPWGGVQAITGTGALNLRFPGQWFQLETGLHYNWHRSYDPILGRYTQPDPLGFVDGPSVYGYAGGSPQVYVDKDGRWIWIPRALWAACKEFRTICAEIITEVVKKAYCLARDFWEDETGGNKGRKRDLQQIDDVIRQVEREESITIDKDMRRELHDEIQKKFGRGKDNATYKELLDIARSLFGKK
jgi:RHS repeat-associated protein